MAWTTPGTAVAGAVLESSFWNSNVRDNTLHLYAQSQYPYRNLLYNGAMQISQRGTSTASITASNYYTADRWKTDITTLGTWTQSVENDAPTGSGLRRSLKMLCTTADASPAAGDLLNVAQLLEGFDCQRIAKGTSSAQALVLTFWVKSNVTGTYTVLLYDSDNNRSISKSYTISASATWEQKEIAFAADTTGTLNNDNLQSLELYMCLGAGSSFTSGALNTSWNTYAASTRATGQVNVASAINNYWQITGVQLEAGSVSTPFEFLPYGDELARCQRYYYRNTPNRTAYPVLARGQAAATTSASVGLKFPVSMRTNPTALETSGTASHYAVLNATLGLVTCTALAIGSNGETTTEEGWIVVTVASGLVSGNATSLHANNTTSAYLGFSAEL